tara:strand:+ start:596 stop:913 length:318 start_codon:yes stop_codon:yes gene_type:complete
MNRTELLKAIEKEFGIGCAVICKERARQKEVKGYDVKRDRDQYYKNEELAEAAVAYAVFPDPQIDRTAFWPWSLECWNPTPDKREIEFGKAGALIAAQLDVLNLS